jgi:hypothetical protein
MAELVKSFDQICRETFGDAFGSSEALAEYAASGMELQKAMASTTVAGQAYGDFGALRLEDLDSTMTAVLFKAEHLKMQRWIARTPARQLIWQYDVQTAYGNSRGMSGFAEGLGPAGGISKYARKTAQIMFKGRMGGITHQASMMRSGMLIDPVAAENSNRTLELLEVIERELVFGMASMTDQAGNVINYDGLFYQIKNNAATPPENIIDMRGAPLDFSVFDNIAQIMADQRFITDFGRVKAFMGGAVKADMSQLLRQQDRRVLGGLGSQPDGGYVPGAPIGGYQSQFGYIPFEHDIFLEPVAGKRPVNVSAGDPVSTLTQANIAGGGLAASGTGSQLAAGTYYYFVGTLYADGETGPSNTGGSAISVAATAGQGVTVTITRPGAIDPSLRGYRLYRGVSNDPNAARWIADVADPHTGTTLTYTDTNQIIPGTDIMLILEGSPENLVIAQLAPLMRFPLPPNQTTLPFYLLLYHTLVNRAPQRQFLVYNIGRLV